MSTLPPTATLAADQKRAMRQAQSIQDAENHGAIKLVTQDNMGVPNYLIYIYNILDIPHVIEQAPQFAHYPIPACPRGQKFAYNIISAFVNETYFRPGTDEIYYKPVDGRKYATSLLNPSAFPGTNWEGQLYDWPQTDQFGNNKNAIGCFWSLTRPDETDKLDVEIALFRERAEKTMNALIKSAEALAAAGNTGAISPMMHFAMDYLGKTATWHMSLKHMIQCPNCGDTVLEGISYHRNAFGEKCIIDRERYMRSIDRRESAPVEDEEEVVAPAPAKKRKKV